MANTNLLKTVVEKEIIASFCNKHKLQLIDLSKKKMHEIFDDMEPDLVGYHALDKSLYIGEITTSGYMGQRGRDFHIGAIKKVFEAFSKFHLFHDDMDNIIKRITKTEVGIEIEAIKCFFIVPEGSRFINALGYRKRLFEKGYMSLERIELTEETKTLMIKVLTDSKNEIKT